MPLSIDKPKLDNLANEIWKSAERLRGKFKAYEYQNVVLPIIVLRRLECVLLKWREKSKAEIREKQPERSEADIDALVKKLEQNVQQTPFSNETDWTLRKVFEEDHTLLEEKAIPMEVAELTAIPSNTIPVDEKHGKALLRLMDLLEDHDDVQKVYSNFDISDEVMAAIEASS